MGIALALHLLAATLWVGGTFFAFVCLRPSTAELDAAHRVKLWADALALFSRWTLAAIVVLLGTGLWMVFSVLGGMEGAGRHVHIMLGLGVLMMLLAGHMHFAPLKRLRRDAAEHRWSDAGKALGRIRVLLAVNLVLGLATMAIGSGGRYFFR